MLTGKSSDPYVGRVALMKIGAAYVPLHASFPINRLDLILEGVAVESVREIEYTDAAQRETPRRAVRTPLSRAG